MIAALWFCAGAVVGIIGTVTAGVVIINRPPHPRTTPIYAVNAGGSTRTTGPESTYDFITRRLR
jgi:hypothetical protein